MRVAPVALLHWRSSLEEALAASDRITEITHDHPEGIKGARAVTEAIWLALRGECADGVRRQITNRYGYDLERSLEAIRPFHRFDVTCQGTVPTALICALESTSLEDAVRNAVSLGGDADTLAAIAGAVGEAMHGVPDELVRTARERYLNDAQDITVMLDALYERSVREAAPETGAAIAQRLRSRARATCQVSQSAQPDQWESRVMQVVREVRTSIGEVGRELPDEFRPAHLSVALVDAVFNPQLHYYRQVVPIVERYCDRFGLKRLRDSDDRVPPREAQETLAELVRHYEELGLLPGDAGAKVRQRPPLRLGASRYRNRDTSGRGGTVRHENQGHAPAHSRNRRAHRSHAADVLR